MRGFKLDIILVLTLGLAAGEWLAFHLLWRANRLLTHGWPGQDAQE